MDGWRNPRPAYPSGIYTRVFDLGPVPKEPKAIDLMRTRPLLVDLTPDDMQRLYNFVIKPERNRGYR